MTDLRKISAARMRRAPIVIDPPAAALGEAACLVTLHDAGVHSLTSGDVTTFCETALDTVLRILGADSGLLYVRVGESSELRLAAQRRPLSAEARQSDARPLVSSNGETVGVIASYSSVSHSFDHVPAVADPALRVIADFLALHESDARLRDRQTEDREARARAEAGEQRRDLFLATLSHELRQPLSAAIPALALLGRSGDADRRALELLDEQLRHLVRLVDDVTDLASVSRGTLRIQRRSVDVRRIVEAAVAATAPLFQARRQRVSVDCGDAVACVWADETRIKQVLSNLLQNAATYTPVKGRVQVRVNVQKTLVRIAIKDNGIGISDEMLPRIFDLFRGAEAPVSPHFGIGLALVREIVELHGGTIGAVSEGAGTGAEFTITLPVQPCQPAGHAN